MTTKKNGSGSVTLSDRYLRMALELRRLDDKHAAIKKSMQLIEQDAEAGKTLVSQTELPIDDDDEKPAEA